MSRSIPRVIAQARAQIEGYKSRPELAKFAPRPLAVLLALLDKLLVAEDAQETLKKGLRVATDVVYQSAADLNGALQLNLASVRVSHGPHAPELVVLGGKARNRGRRAATPHPDAIGSTS